MSLFGRFLCKIGRHKRSRRRVVRRADGVWVSRCRRCDKRMERDEQGRWHVVKAAPAAS